jgi:hypothetical protein
LAYGFRGVMAGRYSAAHITWPRKEGGREGKGAGENMPMPLACGMVPSTFRVNLLPLANPF